MIEVTRLNGSRFYVNDAMIEFLEETPDTIITLNTEKACSEGIYRRDSREDSCI